MCMELNLWFYNMLFALLYIRAQSGDVIFATFKISPFQCCATLKRLSISLMDKKFIERKLADPTYADLYTEITVSK